MTSKIENISSGHLSSDELLRYHRRLLSVEEENNVKKHLEGCEFCSDAMKGISEMNDAMHIYTITHELKKRLKKRVSFRKKIFSSMDLLSIVMILFVIGLIILLAVYFIIIRWN